MDKLKDAFDKAEKIMLKSFERDGDVSLSEAKTAKIAGYGAYRIRKQKIDLLRDNWDLFTPFKPITIKGAWTYTDNCFNARLLHSILDLLYVCFWGKSVKYGYIFDPNPF